MLYKAISAHMVAPSIGAEVEAIDLTDPLSDFQIEIICEALLQYLVIFSEIRILSQRNTRPSPGASANFISIPLRWESFLVTLKSFLSRPMRIPNV